MRNLRRWLGKGVRQRGHYGRNWGKEDGYVQNTWYERKLGS